MFLWRNKKNINIFGLKKVSYQELCRVCNRRFMRRHISLVFCINPDRTLSCTKLIVLGFNDTSTLEGHFVSSPREREKRDKKRE